MIDWLAANWSSVYPNLEASVLWVPVTLAVQAIIHRWQLVRHLRHHREHVVRDVVAEMRRPPPG